MTFLPICQHLDTAPVRLAGAAAISRCVDCGAEFGRTDAPPLSESALLRRLMPRTKQRTANPGIHRVRSERRTRHDPEFDVAARIAADQAASRASREHWLELERAKYRLPRRGRLIDDMPI